jgi:hypothetical protein
MNGVNRFILVSASIAAGICFQLLLVWADTRVTPEKVVVEFSKAYFKLDPKMGRWIASERKMVDDVDLVQKHFANIQTEAIERGVSINWLKSRLSQIQAYTMNETDDRLQVRIIAKRRTAINPVYAAVAQLFGIGNVYPVDEVIDVVEEDGQWKVTGQLFSFPVG